MPTRQQFCLLAFVLPLALFSAGFSPLPGQRFAKGIRPQPIQAAYEQIRKGMTDEELSALMAPYKEQFTEHRQWRGWTAGNITVVVTLWRDQGPDADDRLRVQEKDLVKVEFDGEHRRLIQVSGTHVRIFPGRRGARQPGSDEKANQR